MNFGTKVLAIVGGALVLALAGLLIIATLIPEERVASAAAARAEAILGTRVRIASADLDLLPLPGVRLTGVSVGGDSDSTALALVERIEMRARLLPLLRREIVIRSLDLDRPRVLIEIDSAGRPNLPLLAGEEADTAEAAVPRSRDIDFAIEGVTIDGGRVGFRDQRDGTVLRMDGWTQRLALSGHLERGELSGIDLAGWIAFDDVDGRLPDVVLPARNLRLRIDHDASLDRVADRLTLRGLDIAVNGVTLSGTGTIDGVSSAAARSARLELTADDLEAAELLAWAPDTLRSRLTLPDGRSLGLFGVASIDATVEGPLSTDSFPDLHGTLTVRDAAVMVEGEPVINRLRGTTAFSLDSVVARLEGQAFNERFGAGFAIRNPAAPRVVAAVSGGLELERATALGLVPDTLGLEGLVVFDVRTQVDLDDRSGALAIGYIDLNGITAATDPAVEIPFAAIRLSGKQLTVQQMYVQLGEDRVPVSVELAAEGVLPAVLDSTAPAPRVMARIEAPKLDLDALLGPSESTYPPLLFARLRDRPIDGRTAAALADEAGLAVPTLPRVDARVTAVIGELVRNELTYTDVEAELRIRPDVLELESARFGLMGGTVEAAGRLEPVETDGAGTVTSSRLAARYVLDDVGARPFFDRLTPFRDHLSGSLDLAGSVGMTLDRNALPDRNTVTADGTLAIADGRLANWTVLQAIASRLGLAALDTVRFRDWAGSFRATGPLVALDETVLRGPRLDARAAGSFDLGGSLDLGATLYLTEELGRRAGELGQEVMAAAATDGRVPVGLTLTGTVEAPEVGLDLSEARTAVVDRAREAAAEEVRQAADRVTREIAGEVAERFELPDSLRGLPADSLRAVLGDSLFGLVPDSLKLPTDSLATEAEAALKARLRRLWPGGGGG